MYGSDAIEVAKVLVEHLRVGRWIRGRIAGRPRQTRQRPNPPLSEDHIAVEAAAQKYIDSSISKTINCPKNISFEAFKDIYRSAYAQGCKGCTTYRPNEVTGAVLETTNAAAASAKVSASPAAPAPMAASLSTPNGEPQPFSPTPPVNMPSTPTMPAAAALAPA